MKKKLDCVLKRMIQFAPQIRLIFLIRKTFYKIKKTYEIYLKNGNDNLLFIMNFLILILSIVTLMLLIFSVVKGANNLELLIFILVLTGESIQKICDSFFDSYLLSIHLQ